MFVARLTRAFHTSRTVWIRDRLQVDMKAAMKARNREVVTTIRSVIAEVTNADKAASAPVPDATIFNLIRKSIARRNDAASQFRAASRPDLAEKEESEITLLEAFLPTQLSNSEVDAHIAEAVTHVKDDIANANLPNGALLGKVLKQFYDKVDRSVVQGDAVTKKVRELLGAK